MKIVEMDFEFSPGYPVMVKDGDLWTFQKSGLASNILSLELRMALRMGLEAALKSDLPEGIVYIIQMPEPGSDNIVVSSTGIDLKDLGDF